MQPKKARTSGQISRYGASRTRPFSKASQMLPSFRRTAEMTRRASVGLVEEAASVVNGSKQVATRREAKNTPRHWC